MVENIPQQAQQLKITALSLNNFRNYKSLKLQTLGDLSIFVGENAIGKTSIIEAIQLMTELQSFRATHASELINWGAEEASVVVDISDGERQLEEQLIVQNNKRQYLFQGKSKRIQDLKGLLPAVIFTPDNLDLVKGSYSKRRDALDNLGVQLSKNFYSVRADYQKLIKQKNQALKDEADQAFIESLNEVLVKVGVQYIMLRFALLESFCPYLKQYYQGITDGKEDISLQYELSWSEEYLSEFSQVNKDELIQNFTKALEEHIEKERDSKRCKIGPQADHIDFFIKPVAVQDFRNASIYASQGQQRSVVLAFKMAELKTIQEILHQKPVLLLDDVMSELDEARRSMFMELIQGDIQTFITTTNLAYFNDSIIMQADIYSLPFEGTQE